MPGLSAFDYPGLSIFGDGLKDSRSETINNFWVDDISSNIIPDGLVFYALLWLRNNSPFRSADLYRHICTVTGATWGIQGRTFGTTDEIETPNLGLTDADDYTICEWFEEYFRVLVNEGGVGKTYYINGVNISPATFTPTYSLTTNKILEAVE